MWLHRRWGYVLLIAALVLAAATTAFVVVSAPGNKAAQTPSRVINLTDWKLTLPVDTGHEGNPDEIKQPELSSYQSEFFRAAPNNGVAFRATAGGVTTDGSDFARTELREMTNGGARQAAWSSKGTPHSMTIREAITHLPTGRRAIVAGQVHDSGNDYAALVRLDGNELYVKADGESKGDLDANYQLGTVFTVKIEAMNGVIRIYYNGVLKVALTRNCDACYFKAGAYLQSNTNWDRPNAYGEVIIYNLFVSST